MNPLEHLQVCGSEEAGEVAVAADELHRAALATAKAFCKCLRFGGADYNPERGLTTVEVLVAELNDLEAVVEMVQEAGLVLPGLHDRSAIEAKKEKVRKYMRHAAVRGTLAD